MLANNAREGWKPLAATLIPITLAALMVVLFQLAA